MKYIFLIILLVSMVGATCSQNQVNINSASLKELDKIIWVGAATAQKIVNDRPYKTIDELTKVKGIGSGKLHEIKKQGMACVGSGISSINETHIGIESVKPKVQKHKSAKIISKNKTVPKIYGKRITTINKTPETISLNERPSTELVFESRNSEVIKYLPYAFSVFLIFIIVILAWERF